MLLVDGGVYIGTTAPVLEPGVTTPPAGFVVPTVPAVAVLVKVTPDAVGVPDVFDACTVSAVGVVAVIDR